MCIRDRRIASDISSNDRLQARKLFEDHAMRTSRAQCRWTIRDIVFVIAMLRELSPKRTKDICGVDFLSLIHISLIGVTMFYCAVEEIDPYFPAVA